MKQKPIEQKQIQVIQKQLSPVAEQAKRIAITDNSSLREATALLSILNKYNDEIDNEKQKVLRPLLDATKAERARWKPIETIYSEAMEAIRSKMSLYQTQLVQGVEADKQRIASRIAPGKGNLTIDTAVKQIESLPTIEKETATKEGLVQFREKKQLKITDLSSIPDIYWHINEDLLLEDLKKGMIIPGAELEIIQVPVNYR